MMDRIKLTIDNKEIETSEGKTILDAARDNGIRIPTLCYHAKLLPIGSCRVCIVEVEGYSNPIASCATPALDGMKVTTQSDRLFAMRQSYLKLLLIHHPLECPICDAGGECDLQNIVFEHKIECVDLGAAGPKKRLTPYATPLIKYFENRCVLCLRCIHACREVSGRGVLDLDQKGIEAHMAPVNTADCISCGDCLSVCPVGALTEGVSRIKSRVWQVERTQTTCPHCGFGCRFSLDVQQKRYVTDLITSVDDKPNRGSLCVMGRFGYDFVNHEARLRRPLLRTSEDTREVSSSEAVNAAESALRGLDAEGKAIGFLVSARATSEEIYLINELAGKFKNPVVATSASYHTGKVFELFKLMGIPYAYEYDKLLGCDVILVAGANLLSNNHVFGNKVREAVKLNGAKVVLLDPSSTPLSRIAHAHLKVIPGQDARILNAISARITDEAAYSPEAKEADGFVHFSRILESFNQAPNAQEAGITVNELERVYGLVKGAKSLGVIFGTGITQYEESLAALLNLCLLKNAHKDGVVAPIARQSNAVGAAAILDKFISPDELLGREDVAGLFIFQDDPFHYLNRGVVERALSAKKFLLVADAFPTTVTSGADVVVPIGTFAEKQGTCIAGDGYVRERRAVMNGSPTGFGFLKELLVRFGGTEYSSVDDVTQKIREKGIVSKAADGSERLDLFQGNSSGRTFHMASLEPITAFKRAYILILRDLFLNHYFLGKDMYSRGIATVFAGTDYPITEDRLFISPEDAEKIGLREGDGVTLTSDEGSVTKAVTIKDGLRPGVLEYLLFKDRREALRLSSAFKKLIDVSVEKG
jgi:NADH-quinone oxidoreductase subunit G